MGGALMNGISALIKESSFAPSATEGHNEKTAIYEPGIGLSPDTKSAGATSETLEL